MQDIKHFCADRICKFFLFFIGRWKGGRSIKLEGSDHVPVCMSLEEIPNIQQHNTPSLSTRYCPQVYGCQQTIGMNILF